jgi:predicted nucleotidyltransferase
MNFDLRKRTIFLTLAGSRAYGTDHPDSDWDYRGIAIPPMESYLGLRYSFENAVDKDNWKLFPDLMKPDADSQILELSKFCRLALECNPSIIEILFSEDVLYEHPIMKDLIDNRKLFLSKQAKARFSGYAISQLKRIFRHKKWLDAPLDHKPTRSEFGLKDNSGSLQDQLGAAEALINHEVKDFILDQNNLSDETKISFENEFSRILKKIWTAINHSQYPIPNIFHKNEEECLRDFLMKEQGFSENFIEVLRKERLYRAAKQNWDSYQTWLETRNPKRAEIEKKHKYDCKNALHLVRLLRMAREILEIGQVKVKRPDAEELKEILNGAWSFEKICKFAEEEDIALNEVMKKSSLPAKPNVNKINEIVCEMILKFNKDYI